MHVAERREIARYCRIRRRVPGTSIRGWLRLVRAFTLPVTSLITLLAPGDQFQLLQGHTFASLSRNAWFTSSAMLLPSDVVVFAVNSHGLLDLLILRPGLALCLLDAHEDPIDLRFIHVLILNECQTLSCIRGCGRDQLVGI